MNEILEILKDGEWHLFEEKFSPISGKIYELREKGFKIESQRISGTRSFEYRLLNPEFKPVDKRASGLAKPHKRGFCL